MSRHRTMDSPYMHWAKTHQAARYTLAVSGMKSLSLAELGATWDDVSLDAGPGYGLPALQEALAAKAGVSADRIVLATGTSGANHLAFATLLDSGDEVAMERPGYEPMESLARHLGATVRYFPRRAENGFRIDPADIAAEITPRTRLVVLSNLHNPTSVSTDEATLLAIRAIAEGSRAKVLVDEAYLDAAFDSAPPSAARLGDVFVVTTSLTKVFGLNGLRCGWIVTEPALASRMWQLKNLFGVNEAHPAACLSVVALRKSAELLTRARRILANNRAAWASFIAGRNDLAVEGESRGTTVFPRVLTCDADALCAHLRGRYETSLVPGRFFGDAACIRVGLCGDEDIFPQGLARLGSALDDLRGSA